MAQGLLGGLVSGGDSLTFTGLDFKTLDASDFAII